jgi:hypothetical protein
MPGGGTKFRSFVNEIQKDFPTMDEFIKNSRKNRQETEKKQHGFRSKSPARKPFAQVGSRISTSLNRGDYAGLSLVNGQEIRKANMQLAIEQEE